jgi:hypothetical protein
MEEAIYTLTERKIRELMALLQVQDDSLELPLQHVNGIRDFSEFAVELIPGDILSFQF